MGSVFRFKQFEVDQRDCAMKINTDGVLLGAIASFEQPKYILDIGSGTGVISLMLAQRFDKAIVEAVEIDEAAYHRTKANFENAKFSSRLNASFGSFEDLDASLKFDLIVSNPPFYTNSLHNPDEKKRIARHTDHDFFVKMLTFAKEHLLEEGSLQLILPTELADEVILMGKSYGLLLNKKIEVRSFENSEVFRLIVDLKKQPVSNPEIDNVIIYKTKGEHSDQYKELLSTFFLAY